jgi:hypothetical protein
MSVRDAGPRLGRGLAALLGEDTPTQPKDSSIQLLSLDIEAAG